MTWITVRKHTRPEAQDRYGSIIQGQNPTCPRFGLAQPNRDRTRFEVYLLPTEQSNLRVPHARIERKQDCWKEGA